MILTGLVLGGVGVMSAASHAGNAAPGRAIAVRSSAFVDGGSIPVKHTGDGADVSPELTWDGVPEGTGELVLICDDPDAPTREPWVHWIIYGIAPTMRGLPEGLANDMVLDGPVKAAQGKNSWPSGRTVGYRGPAPPPGKLHHYRFRLYAVDRPLGLRPAADRAALARAMTGHVLAWGELVGTYRR